MLFYSLCIVKPGVHIIATIATMVQKELSDKTVCSVIATIAIATIAEIENILLKHADIANRCDRSSIVAIAQRHQA